MISIVLFVLAAVCFLLKLFSIEVGSIDLVALGLLFFVLGHLPWNR